MSNTTVAGFLDSSRVLKEVSSASPLPVTGGGEAAPGGDAQRATAVQGITGGKPVATAPAPSAAAAHAIKPAVTTAAGATILRLKASPGNFYGATLIAGSVAGYLIVYNETADPQPNDPLPAAKRLHATSVLAGGTASLGDLAIPDLFDAGIVLLFSTSLTTYTPPSPGAQFMRGRAA